MQWARRAPPAYVPIMDPRLAAAAGFGAALLSVAVVDAVRPDSWTGTGMALSAEGAIAVIVEDGTDYSIPLDVSWTDVQGRNFDGGRPDCLPPTGKEEGPVQVIAEEVTTPLGTNRQVVHVTCLGPT